MKASRLFLGVATCVATFGLLGAGLLGACDDTQPWGIPPVKDTGASDSVSLPDASIDSPKDSPADGLIADAAPPEFLTRFDAKASQLPEGLTELGGGAGDAGEAGAGAGTPLVGFAPLAQIVSVGAGADAAVTQYGVLPGIPTNSLTLGLALDSAGLVYVGVAASGATPVPPPGVYRFASGGGTATLFTSSVTPPMSFANGLDF